MIMVLLHLVAFLTLTFTHLTQAAPQMASRRYTPTVTRVVQDILENFPQCDLILVQDGLFSSTMNGWMASLKNPYYSITFDGAPFPDYTTWQKITKTTGFLCSTLVVTCISYNTCRIPDSTILYKMLIANGILLKERRSLVYIEEAKYDNTTLPKLVSYQKPNVQEYRFPFMNKVAKILWEINSHITFIHELPQTNKSKKAKVLDTVFEIVTFSPNWFPGGTPILKSVWSTKQGFLTPPSFILDLDQARPGGLATFCVTSKHMLPSIHIHPDGTIQGIDGELIKAFQRRFQFLLKFIEPDDKDFGSKGENGKWSGVIGDLIAEKADFGLGQITFTQERFATGLKFSQTVLLLQAVLICPLPKLLPRYEILTYPFDPSLWIWVLGTSISFIIVLEILQRIACRLFGIKFTVGKKTIFLKLRRQRMLPWIQTLGPLFLRSVSLQALPRRWGVLGVFSTWLFFTLIVNVYYTTILIGSLTVFPRDKYLISPFSLLNENKRWVLAPIVNQSLSNSTHMRERLLLQRATTLPQVLEDAEGPLDSKVYNFINSTGDCGVAEATRSKYYLSQNFTVKFRNHEYARMYLSRDAIFIGPQGWVLRADMDFLVETYLDILILQFRSFGFIEKARSGWQTNEHRIRTPTIKPLSMSTVEPVFLISGYFIAISLVVFVAELLMQFHTIQLCISSLRSRYVGLESRN